MSKSTWLLLSISSDSSVMARIHFIPNSFIAASLSRNQFLCTRTWLPTTRPFARCGIWPRFLKLEKFFNFHRLRRSLRVQSYQQSDSNSAGKTLISIAASRHFWPRKLGSSFLFSSKLCRRCIEASLIRNSRNFLNISLKPFGLTLTTVKMRLRPSRCLAARSSGLPAGLATKNQD